MESERVVDERSAAVEVARPERVDAGERATPDLQRSINSARGSGGPVAATAIGRIKPSAHVLDVRRSPVEISQRAGGEVLQRELDEGRFTPRFDDGDERDEILDDLVIEATGADPDTVPGGADSHLEAYLATSTLSKAQLESLLDDLIVADSEYTPEEHYRIHLIDKAHDALLYSILDNDLGDDGVDASNAWFEAVKAGVWPLAGDPPAGFAEAAAKAKSDRLAQEASDLQAIADDRVRAVKALLQAWRDDGRLLAGTVFEIDKKTSETSPIETYLANLSLVYAEQCKVTRANWLSYLECTRADRIDGSKRCHFTTFANGVMPGVAHLPVGATVPELLTSLFAGATWDKQIHATVVEGRTRYHRYWNGRYTSKVDGGYANEGEPAKVATKKELDAEWTRMKEVMTTRVTAAKAQHGRIGANSFGKQTKVDDLL